MSCFKEKKLKIGAVIAEYNPFHNGHAYQLEDFRRGCGLDYVIVVMSGDFVQRGEPAICEKRERVMWALKGGADAVFELPVYYTVANAMCFARGAVGTIAGIADALGFGSEITDRDILLTAADICNVDFCDVQDGKSYPRLVYETVAKKYGEDISRVFSNPNATLAMEYVRAIRDICPNTEIHITQRKGALHDDCAFSNGFASAAEIRSRIYRGEAYREFVPEFVDVRKFLTLDDLGKLILYKLRTMSPEELENIADVSEGLHNLIHREAFSHVSYGDFLSAIKSKRYTLARLKRICINALLSVTRDMPYASPQYIHLLGVREQCRNELLSEISKRSRLPLVVKYKDYKKHTDISYQLMKIDTDATDVYSLFYEILPRDDFRKKVQIF